MAEMSDSSVFYTVLLIMMTIGMSVLMYFMFRDILDTYTRWSNQNKHIQDTYANWAFLNPTRITDLDEEDLDYEEPEYEAPITATALEDAQTDWKSKVERQYEALKAFKTRNDIEDPDKVYATEVPVVMDRSVHSLGAELDDYEYPDRADQGFAAYLFGKTKDVKRAGDVADKSEIEELRAEMILLRNQMMS